MSTSLLYTFRTFPDQVLTKHDVNDVFIFGKLREDLARFEACVQSQSPKLIIGFALSNISRQETVAINKFNNGTIDMTGPADVTLQQLNNCPFPAAQKPTHSFCNWTMYMIARKHRLVFFHVAKTDIPFFFAFIHQLNV